MRPAILMNGRSRSNVLYVNIYQGMIEFLLFLLLISFPINIACSNIGIQRPTIVCIMNKYLVAGCWNIVESTSCYIYYVINAIVVLNGNGAFIAKVSIECTIQDVISSTRFVFIDVNTSCTVTSEGAILYCVNTICIIA